MVFFLGFFLTSIFNGVFGQVAELGKEKGVEVQQQKLVDTLALEKVAGESGLYLDDAFGMSTKDMANVKVFGMNGHLIKNLSLKNPEEILHIDGLTKGSYWVTFSNKEGVIARRLEVE